LSSLSANLLTKDTVKRSADEVATAIESVGGSFSEFSGNNTFGLSIEVLPGDLDLALDLLEQSLFHLKIDRGTFNREREGQIALIKETLDDVVDFGIRELREKFFGEFPYSVGSDGRIEDLEKLKPSDAESFLGQMIRAENCVIAVSGLIDRESLEDCLASLAAKLPKGFVNAPDCVFNEPARTGREEAILDREQAVVFQAFPCVGVLQDELMVQAAVLDELFSGMSSQLFERVRDELGLAYFVGSSRIIGMESGMFFLYGGTHPSTAEKVLDEMSREVERVKSGGIEPDELERIKTRLNAQRRMSMQAIGSRAMQAGLNAIYGLPVNDWMNFGEKLNRVTVESLAEFAGKYFDLKNRLELVVRAG
jgi:zinc protease